MHFLKKTLVWLATVFLPLWLFLAATTASIVLTVNSPTKIKSWVSKSGVYTKAVDAVLAEGQKSAEKSGDKLPISEPGVQAAAKKAFNPTVLQGYTENVIDGMYHWLQGKTPQPDFKLDLSGPKKQFAIGFGDYLRQRAQTLPACTRGQVPSSTDIADINCIPRGYDVNTAIQQQVDKQANSKEFLGDPVITAKSLKSDNGQSVFDKNKKIPQIYQKATLGPLLLGGLALLGVVIIVFLHDSRRKGMKHVAWILLPLGALLALVGGGILVAARRLDTQVHLNGAAGAKLQPAVISLLHSITGSLSHVYLLFGIGYMVVGTGLVVAVKLWFKPAKPAAPDKPAEADKKPEKPAVAKPAGD